MSRNFGLGSRNMDVAVHKALEMQILSFSSIDTMERRFSLFLSFVKNGHNVRKLEQITLAMLAEYGQELATKVRQAKLSPQTAQCRVSAVNRIMEMVRNDREIWQSPTKDCGIKRRSYIAVENRATSFDCHEVAKTRVSERVAVLLDLSFWLGLRFEECAKLNARKILKEAATYGFVTITDGTKGGRDRIVPITPEWMMMQISVLERAIQLQGDHRSMIPVKLLYKTFRNRVYRETRAANIRFHPNRHAYAQRRYELLMGLPCPIVAGVPHGKAHYKFLAQHLGISIEEAKQKDHEIRLKIAEELGHCRKDITNAYLG